MVTVAHTVCVGTFGVARDSDERCFDSGVCRHTVLSYAIQVAGLVFTGVICRWPSRLTVECLREVPNTAEYVIPAVHYLIMSLPLVYMLYNPPVRQFVLWLISKWLTMSSTDAAVVRVGKPEERYTYLKRGSCGVMWSIFCSSQRGRNGKRNPRSRSAGLESKGITGGGVMNAETTAIIPLLCIHSVPGNIQLTWVIGWRHNCHSPRSAWSAAVIATIISHQRTKTDAWTVDWWRRPRTASSAVEDEQLRQSFKPHLHHTNWTQLTCSELQSRRFPCNCFVVDCVGLLCSHSKLSKC